MALSTINGVYFILFTLLVTCLLHKAMCEGTSDFSEDDYDELNRDASSKPFDRAYGDEASPRVKTTLTADKIQEYLLNLQPKVLSNNDVLTVKDRAKSPVKTVKPDKVNVDKFSSDPFVKVHELQSDQPTNGQWNQNTSPAVTKREKQNVATDKPEDTFPSHSRDRFAQEPPSQMNMWNCEFKPNHDCGIVNDLSIGEYFHLESKNFFRNFNWKSWYLMLNASALPREAVGARLITPYMDVKNASQGCLSMQYITVASGVSRVTLYQQDKGNQCLWSSEPQSSSPSIGPVNHQLDFTVDLFRGSPRFFLELYLDLSDPVNARDTVFALANLRLTYRACFNDNSNHCKPKPARSESDVRMP